MSTKTQIQTLINNNLADGSSITASEHREVEIVLLNELYPTNIYETRDDNTITTQNTNAAYLTNSYEINIVKQGRLVTISGKLINESGNSVTNSINAWFFQIVGTEYLQSSATPLTIGFVSSGSGTGSIQLLQNKLYCAYLGGLSTINFQLTYTTQN
jgi:hypothetical protein